MFTEDWFTRHIPQWRQHVQPHIAGRKAQWLEIGSYEGRSALWTMENLLTHPESRLTCLDLWGADIGDRFKENLQDHLPRITQLKGDCFPYLLRLAVAEEKFDGIYVDADHQAKAALTEAAIGWRMLKKGGFMIFDDYPWQHKTPFERRTKLPPKPGIDAFLECWQYELRVLHKGWQVIVQKL